VSSVNRMMKLDPKIFTCLTLATGSSLFAFPYDDDLVDVPDSVMLNGVLTQANGTAKICNIPIKNWPDSIQVNLQGGDGGSATGLAWGSANQTARGGGGAVIAGSFPVDPTEANALRPGGELRLIVGSAGGRQSILDLAAGSGGGGTGLLYRAPVDGAEWVPLLIAGGGGGGAVSSLFVSTWVNHGNNANTTTGGDSVGDSNGGSDGENGQGWENGSGGGAGWLDDAVGSQGGKMWESGGAGGSLYDGKGGGFGCGGGGASHRLWKATSEGLGGWRRRWIFRGGRRRQRTY